MDPGWVIWKRFKSEILMVRHSGDQIAFCSGGQKKDVTKSIGWVKGQEMCGPGTWWDW